MAAVGSRSLQDVSSDSVLRGACDEGLGDQGLALYPVTDLIADLLHLARRYDGKPEALLDAALIGYGGDVLEQAFEEEPSDGSGRFTDCLNDPANREPAVELLRIAGVPGRLHDRVLDTVGIGHAEA